MASADWAWMAAVAGEELAKLEAAQPGRYGPLKAELKRLIAEPGWDAAAGFPLASPDIATPTCSSSSLHSAPAGHAPVSTQESSNQKRKWGGGGGAAGQEEGKRRRKVAASGVTDRADVVIERAVKCLKRIRAVKKSLLGFTFKD